MALQSPEEWDRCRGTSCNLVRLSVSGDCFVVVLCVLYVTQPMGWHEGGREEKRWGRTCDGWREVFFPSVEEKQFVVLSPSRKHQPLFPLNQQCENGVSVWVKTREREERWNRGGETRMAPQPDVVCSPPLALPRGTHCFRCSPPPSRPTLHSWPRCHVTVPL